MMPGAAVRSAAAARSAASAAGPEGFAPHHADGRSERRVHRAGAAGRAVALGDGAGITRSLARAGIDDGLRQPAGGLARQRSGASRTLATGPGDGAAVVVAIRQRAGIAGGL